MSISSIKNVIKKRKVSHQFGQSKFDQIRAVHLVEEWVKNFMPSLTVNHVRVVSFSNRIIKIEIAHPAVKRYLIPFEIELKNMLSETFQENIFDSIHYQIAKKDSHYVI